MPAKLAQPSRPGALQALERMGADGAASMAATGRQRTVTAAPTGRHRRTMARIRIAGLRGSELSRL